MHDPTLWQPLALGQVAAQGLAPIPSQVQSFVGSQWGHVRGFALHASAKGLPIDPGAPPIGDDASSASYKRQAVAVIRAATTKTAIVDVVAGGLERARERRRAVVAAART